MLKVIKTLLRDIILLKINELPDISTKKAPFIKVLLYNYGEYITFSLFSVHQEQQ